MFEHGKTRLRSHNPQHYTEAKRSSVAEHKLYADGHVTTNRQTLTPSHDAFTACRHAGQYEAVLWVGADQAAKFSRQAPAPDLPDLPDLPGVTIETAQADALRAVPVWLEHTPGWLLIFDNVDDPDDQRALMPQRLGLDAAGGHVLINSRQGTCPEWPV